MTPRSQENLIAKNESDNYGFPVIEFEVCSASSTVKRNFEPLMHIGHTVVSFSGANLVNFFGQSSLFLSLGDWGLV